MEDSVRREALGRGRAEARRCWSLVATIWPSPGVSTETMTLYLAELCRPRIGSRPAAGLDAEQENISVAGNAPWPNWRILRRRRRMVVDMKLLLLIQALKLKRPDLFD